MEWDSAVAVTVMGVGDVRVAVNDGFVFMPMSVRLGWIDAVGVVVRVMVIVYVAMLMGQRAMRVSVNVAVRQQE